MANGYVCVLCGWQETVHKNGGYALEAEDKRAMYVRKEGFRLTQMECGQGYQPSPEEPEYDPDLLQTGGPHEGCH